MSWPIVKLGDVVTIKGGGTPDKSIPAYWGGDIPWASVKDFKSYELSRTVDYITIEGVNASATQVIPAGNIIVPTRMAVGKVAINTVDMAINQDLKAIFFSRHIDREFLLHALLANAETLQNQASGATVKGIKVEVLKNLEIPLPPLEEQKRIAGILDQADALRRLRARALEKLNTLGQAVFQEMFGAGFVNSYKLSDICELINGDRSSNYPNGDDIKENGVLFLSTKNIQNWALNYEKSQFITEDKFNTLSRGKLKRGDIVITLRGTLGQAAIFDGPYETGFINAQMMIIRPSELISSEYLLDFLRQPSTQFELLKGQTGSAVKQLTAGGVGELNVLVPSREKSNEYKKNIAHLNRIIFDAIAAEAEADALFASLQSTAFQGRL